MCVATSLILPALFVQCAYVYFNFAANKVETGE